MLNNIKTKAINIVAQECYDMTKSKGFHDSDREPNRVAVYVANLHGEVSELWEAHRAGTLHQPCDKAEKMAAHGIAPLTNAEEELADIVIRAFDTAVGIGVDIGSAVERKMAYNSTRPRMHGKTC